MRQAVTSPIVARGLLADPAERDKFLTLPKATRGRQQSSGGGGGGGGGPGGAAPLLAPSAGAAAAKGWRAGALLAGAAGPLSGAPTPRTASTLAAGGPAASSAAAQQPPPWASSFSARQSAIGVPAGAVGTAKGLQAAVAALPEAFGLPQDDQMAYLILLRRSVIYGPSLGLPLGGPGPGALGNGGGGGGGMGVVATPGSRPGASMSGGALPLESSPSALLSPCSRR